MPAPPHHQPDQHGRTGKEIFMARQKAEQERIERDQRRGMAVTVALLVVVLGVLLLCGAGR